jgi:hypothetical protein
MHHHIMKLWSFHGWGLNFIGQIHPSSRRHHFIFVGTNYFNK